MLFFYSNKAYSKLMFKLLHLFPYLVVPTNVKKWIHGIMPNLKGLFCGINTYKKLLHSIYIP